MFYKNKPCNGGVLSWMVAVSLLVFIAPSLSAQLSTGTILGVVKDPQGAVVPGATVTVTQMQTNLTRTATTDSGGGYRLPALPVGHYQITVSQPGFQTMERRALTLEVAQELVADFTLQIGTANQRIEVSQEAPLVNTTNSMAGGTVEPRTIAELPLNGRNYVDLTYLQAGVTQNRLLNTPINGWAGTAWSSNGGGERSNTVLLDGASTRVMHGINGSSLIGTTLGVDGIEEFKVVTSMFSAEYGLTSGSQTIIVSKGGTNAFHGAAFEYLRNNALDARNYFDALDTTNHNGFGTNKSLNFPGKRNAPFKRNNFGASLGGPIRKDKTFFFAVFEGVRQRLAPPIATNTIPMACFVDGNGVVQPKIPAVITNVNSFGTCASGAPARISVNPSVLPLAQLFPQPNVTGLSFNYTFPYTEPTGENYGQIRVDHNFSTKDSAFVRYTRDISNWTAATGYPNVRFELLSDSTLATLSETHVFSSALLNNARFSLTRNPYVVTASPVPGYDVAALFAMVPAAAADPKHNCCGDVLAAGNITDMGQRTGYQYLGNYIYSWTDDVFWTKGRHSMKFGTLQDYNVVPIHYALTQAGAVTFATLANFFSGAYSSIARNTGTGPGGLGMMDRRFSYNTLGFYGQDDFRALPTLTLNLGLRYEFTTVPKGYIVRDPLRDSTSTYGDMFINPSLHNFSPRIGFAWNVRGNGKTSVRGGAGIYYDVGNFGTIFLHNSLGTPPLSNPITLVNVSNPPNPPFSLPFPSFVGNQPSSPRNNAYHMQQPSLASYTLAIERQLPWSSVLTVSYVGSHGWHQFTMRDGNPTIPVGHDAAGFPIYCFANAAGACPAGTTLPPKVNPAWGTFLLISTDAMTYYNSLQTSFKKRLSQGVQFEVNYTWSKLLDTCQGEANGDRTVNCEAGGYNINNIDRGPATYDTPQNLRANLLYHLPSVVPAENIAGKLLNGWWVGTIVSALSGYPFTPSIIGDRALQNTSSAVPVSSRPNLDSSFDMNKVIKGTPQQWFDPTMFSLEPAGTLGRTGRNWLRGPGLTTVDLSVNKNSRLSFLGEAGALQFRAEFFNVLNHTNFGTVNPNVIALSGGALATTPAGRIGSPGIPALPTAGQILTTSTQNRQIQFALRVVF